MNDSATQPFDLPDQALVDGVRGILETSPNTLSEYELIGLLNKQGWSFSTSATDTLALFTTHFLVYNALYWLQTHYWQQEGRFLQVSALAIGLHESGRSDSTVADTGTKTEVMPAADGVASYDNDAALRDYYLDSSQLESASQESVDQLLNQFWQRFMAEDEASAAFAIFDLESTANYKAVKQRYRSLAMKYHPDRGGDGERFREVNWAFGVLQRVLKPVGPQ